MNEGHKEMEREGVTKKKKTRKKEMMRRKKRRGEKTMEKGGGKKERDRKEGRKEGARVRRIMDRRRREVKGEPERNGRGGN